MFSLMSDNLHILICLFLMCWIIDQSYGCPTMCFCNVDSRITYCDGKNLANIPTGIPSDVKVLQLQDNNFKSTTLTRANFSRFVDLVELYLYDCDITEINVDAFVDLRKLEWLDLSKNRLKVIHDNTFYGLSSLKRLYLSGNREVKLSKKSFRGLDKLIGLRVDHCELDSINPELLQPVNSTLRTLYLNNNNIKFIDNNCLGIFKKLTHIRLGANPLHCNCKTMWLFEFITSNLQVFSGPKIPWCVTPKRYKNRYLKDLSKSDFQCDVPSFTDVNLAITNNKGVLNCAARGDPLPIIYWTKPSGQTVTYRLPKGSNLLENKAVLNLTKLNVEEEGNTMGTYTCVAANDMGNVTLTLNVSWPIPQKDGKKTNLPEAESEKTTLGFHSTQSNVKYIQLGKKTTAVPIIQTIDTVKPGLVKNSPAKRGSTVSNDISVNSSRRTFTLVELVSAIVGTFVGTLVICVVVVFLFFRGKRKIDKNKHHKFCNKHHSNQMRIVNNQKPAQYQTQQNFPEIMGFIESCETKDNQENQQNYNC